MGVIRTNVVLDKYDAHPKDISALLIVSSPDHRLLFHVFTYCAFQIFFQESPNRKDKEQYLYFKDPNRKPDYGLSCSLTIDETNWNMRIIVIISTG